MYTAEFIERLKIELKPQLGKWGISASAEISLLNVSENATFRVDDNENTRCLIFRVYRSGYHTSEEIESELSWIAALREESVVHTPAPIPTIDGEILMSINNGYEKRFIVAFEFMLGEEPDVGTHLVEWFEKLGAINARLHQHTKKWRLPSGFVRKVWNIETMLGPDAYWGDWRLSINLNPEGKEIIHNVIELIENRLEDFGQDPERYGLVHADLRLANLLVADERLGIIDFDDCGFCWFIYDFAAAISFYETDPSIPMLQNAWVKGYRSVTTLGQEDVNQIPTFIMLRRILLTAWLASHSETPTGQELGSTYTDGTVALALNYQALHI